MIIDDRAGRTAARDAGLTVTGTAGILIEAKRAGLVAAVGPVLQEMRARGYWLSDELIDIAKSLASER